jgi:hypothetical protein
MRLVQSFKFLYNSLEIISGTFDAHSYKMFNTSFCIDEGVITYPLFKLRIGAIIIFLPLGLRGTLVLLSLN